MTVRLGAALVAEGIVLGAVAGVATAVGSWWWLALTAVAVGLAVLLRWAPTLPAILLMVGTSVVAGAVSGAIGYDNRIAGAANSALVAGIACGLVLAVIAVRATRRLQRRELERAQELARSLAAERDAHIAAALVEERSVLAGQIHDQLGHRLTLSTVRLGQLGMDPDLTGEQRRVIETVRDETADITAELGSLVRLLDRGTRLAAPHHHTPDEIVAAAREAGVPVTADLDALHVADPHAVAVMAGVLDEAVANAARHAPGQPVNIISAYGPHGTVVTVTNPIEQQPTPTGSGSGLERVRERLIRVGGTLDVADADGRFSLTASVP